MASVEKGNQQILACAFNIKVNYLRLKFRPYAMEMYKLQT